MVNFSLCAVLAIARLVLNCTAMVIRTDDLPSQKTKAGGQGLPAMRHGHRHRRSIKSTKGVLIEQRSTPDAVS